MLPSQERASLGSKNHCLFSLLMTNNNTFTLRASDDGRGLKCVPCPPSESVKGPHTLQSWKMQSVAFRGPAECEKNVVGGRSEPANSTSKHALTLI